METLLKIALFAHIIAGFVALITGLCAMITKKGGKTHRLNGKIFFYSMLLVSASAIFISLVRTNMFLLMVGIFAFYQNYSGYRAIHNKSLRLSIADKLVLFAATINSGFMIFSFNPVLVVFGFISGSLVIDDFRIYLLLARNKEIPKSQWLVKHIGMMTGSYIATFTAFLVVNVQNFNPYWLPWLAPTLLFVPLIIYWTRKYGKEPKSILVQTSESKNAD